MNRTTKQKFAGTGLGRAFCASPQEVRLLLLTASVAALCSGCLTTGMDPYFASVESDANVYVQPVRSDIVKIAILPFKGPTELIGSSVSDMFVTEMLRANQYTLVERSQMAGVLSETELSMAGLSESRAVEIAKMLGADGVVIGTVDEYSTQAKSGKTYAVTGVSIRLIHCGTGQIIWSGDLAEMSENTKTPLAAHGRAVVHELIAGLYQKWWTQKKRPAQKHSRQSAAESPQVSAPPPPPPAPPPVPGGFSTSDLGLREVTLNWKGAGSSADSFIIERANALEGPFSVIGKTSPSKGSFKDDEGLQDSRVYYYRVVAVGRNGLKSKPSDVVESMTAPPPDPPDNVTASANGSRGVAVSWSPSKSAGVENYRVERSEAAENSVWSLRTETEETRFADGGKAGCDTRDSTKYRYRVTAVNKVGAVGAPSAVAEVETLPPPAAVADFFAMPLQVRCVPLSWAESPESDVIGYEIERRDGVGAITPLAKLSGRDTTTYLDGKRDPGNLPDDRAYEYRIRAFNAIGAVGEWTAPAVAATRPVPPAPEGVAAVGGMPRSAEVAWTMSEDEKVVAYRVQRAEGADGKWEDVDKVDGRETVRLLDRAGASATAPTGRLKDGTGYRYRVSAINTAEAESAWSVTAEAVTKLAPVLPSGLGTTQDVPGKVVLVWEPNPEADIVTYVVEARAEDGSRWREVTRAKGCTAEETGLDAGARRVYRIKAVDANTHESLWSAEVAGAARPLPGSPTSLRSAWSGGGVKLTWAPPREGMTEYRLYRKGLISSERIASSREPEAVLEAAAVGKKITVYVTALDEAGLESRPSEPLEIKPASEG